jgi:hypothetical protein
MAVSSVCACAWLTPGLRRPLTVRLRASRASSEQNFGIAEALQMCEGAFEPFAAEPQQPTRSEVAPRDVFSRLRDSKLLARGPSRRGAWVGSAWSKPNSVVP